MTVSIIQWHWKHFGSGKDKSILVRKVCREKFIFHNHDVINWCYAHEHIYSIAVWVWRIPCAQIVLEQASSYIDRLPVQSASK